jgi:hypothetical protein
VKRKEIFWVGALGDFDSASDGVYHGFKMLPNGAFQG